MDLTSIPAQLQAGDTYRLLLSEPDYPTTDGWVLRFVLAGKSNKHWNSEAEGDLHVIALANLDTLKAGQYAWSLSATLNAERRTFRQGRLTVLADLGALLPGEGQSLAERMLAICQTARENILRGELKGYMINGRQVQMHTLDEVAREEARWQAVKARENGAGRAGFHIGVRFARR